MEAASPKNKAHRKWRENWLHELTKWRVLDAELKQWIENNKVFTSEKHFSGEDIETCKYDRLLLVFTLVVTSNRSALKMIF